jgi:histidine triad (HIT) family protein
MNRKLFLFFICVSGLTVSVYFYFSQKTEMPPEGYCAFCDPIVLNRQKFYDDDLVLALYTHKPVLPGHCLIIPKRHIARFEELTEEEVTQMGRVIKQVHQAASQVFKTSAYLLLQKNGSEVGQSVPHVHFHYIPRKAGDDSILTLLVRTCMTQIQKPIAATEMEKIVKEMKEAMDSAHNDQI